MQASISVKLAWNATPNPNLAGYNIYYGTSSQNYSTNVALGLVSSAVVPNLPENTTYFFAATTRDQTGNQSALSSPIAYIGTRATPESSMSLKILPTSYSNDPLIYSLGSSAPPGAIINPTNGTFSWMPGRSYASTTNLIPVNVTDPVNPAMNLTETIVVVITDDLQFGVGKVTVSAGGLTKLPIMIVSSSPVTNLQIVLNWPGIQLLNPTLTFFSPIVSGSLQKLNGQLIIKLQTTASRPLIGTNLVAQINCQVATGTRSTILSIPTATSAASTTAGVSYNNLVAPSGEVVIVGSNPLLRPNAKVSPGRSLVLYANVGTYQLQYTTSLAKPTVWTTLLTYAQTNLSQTVSLGSTNPIIYYRLHQL